MVAWYPGGIRDMRGRQKLPPSNFVKVSKTRVENYNYQIWTNDQYNLLRCCTYEFLAHRGSYASDYVLLFRYRRILRVCVCVCVCVCASESIRAASLGDAATDVIQDKWAI